MTISDYFYIRWPISFFTKLNNILLERNRSEDILKSIVDIT